MVEPPTVKRRQHMHVECLCERDHKTIISKRISRNGDCWEWQAQRDRNGYGVLNHAGVRWRAHRLSYYAHRGPIPGGLILDHLCDNKACVNPSHLQPTDDRANILRARGMDGEATCVRGHVLSRSGRRRICRECRRIGVWNLADISNDPTDPRHGTLNGYGNLKCRCERCREANTVAHREYMRSRRAVESDG